MPHEISIFLALLYSSWLKEVELWTNVLLIHDSVLLFKNKNDSFERFEVRDFSCSNFYLVIFGKKRKLVLAIDSFYSVSDFKKLRVYFFLFFKEHN